MKSFENRIVLITGGSSGIGLATARLLAAEGAIIWLMARDLLHLQEALSKVRSAGHNHQPHGIIAADVTNIHQVEQAIQEVIQSAGVPDILINSAGQAMPGYFHELTHEVFHQMMDVNYFGTVNVTKALIPAMMQRRSGTIVNISSLAGILGVFGYTAYGASKFAVRGFSDALRAELKPYHIQVSIAYPPDTDTPQLANENQYKPLETKALTRFGGVLSAEAVAQSIIKGIQRHQYLILPGFDSQSIYLLSNTFGVGIFPLLDWIYAQARKRDK